MTKQVAALDLPPIGLLNIFLAPFGIAICTIAPTIAIVNPFGRSFSSKQRNSPEGFTFNAEPALVDNIASTLYKAFLGEYMLIYRMKYKNQTFNAFNSNKTFGGQHSFNHTWSHIQQFEGLVLFASG